MESENGTGLRSEVNPIERERFLLRLGVNLIGCKRICLNTIDHIHLYGTVITIGIF